MGSNRASEETRATEDALEEGTKRPVQRWPAILALLVIAVAYTEVSERLALVPMVVIPAAVLVGILLIWLALMRGRHFLVRPIALVLIGLITLAEIASTLLLVSVLPRGTLGPSSLLKDAAIRTVSSIRAKTYVKKRRPIGPELGRSGRPVRPLKSFRKEEL